MNDRHKLAIAVLCVTAAVLAALIGLSWTGRAAAGESGRAGHYIMFTGTAPGSTDLLYVIDRNSGNMNIYQYKLPGNTLSPVDQLSLRKAFR